MGYLFLVVMIDIVGFAAILPSLPFLALDLGAGPELVTLLIATYSLCNFLVAPLWGRASDRWGRKPILLVGFAGSVASYLLLAFSGALWMVFASRALAGLLTANQATSQAYVSDVTTPAKRARGMGMIGAAIGTGFVIGPAIGGFLAGPDRANVDYAVPAFLAAGLSAVAFVIAAVFLDESHSAAARAAHVAGPQIGRFALFLRSLAYPVLVALIAFSFLTAMVFSSMESTFAIWSESALHWGPRQVGYIFTFAGLVAVLVQAGLVGPLSRRLGEPVLLVQSGLALGLGVGLIPFATGVWTLLPAMALLAYGLGIGNPSLQSLVSKVAVQDARGGALGINQSAASLARIFGPIWAGIVFAEFGRAWPYYAAAGLAVVAVLVALRVIVTYRDRAQS